LVEPNKLLQYFDKRFRSDGTGLTQSTLRDGLSLFED